MEGGPYVARPPWVRSFFGQVDPMKTLAPLGMVHHEHSPARDLALLPPRAALAASMLHHGLEKLGSSREKAFGAFHNLGLRPARFFATITGLAEVGAGAMAALGLFTRPAALAVLVAQAVAIKKVHGPKGFPITRGGFEFNLALMAIATALLIDGPGRLSLHEVIERAVDHRRGPMAKLRRRRSFLSRLLRCLGYPSTTPPAQAAVTRGLAVPEEVGVGR